MIFGSVAYLGSLSLKSAVSTAGKHTLIVSVPLSVSLSTSQDGWLSVLLGSLFNAEAKVH